MTMRDDMPDQGDLEAEGLPAIEDQPPGIDIETEVEGMIPPRDHPLAVEEHGVTAAEQRTPESLGERVAREVPDVIDGDRRVVGRLVQPDGGMVDMDTEATEVAEEVDDFDGLTAEEAAMHIVEP